LLCAKKEGPGAGKDTSPGEAHPTVGGELPGKGGNEGKKKPAPIFLKNLEGRDKEGRAHRTKEKKAPE